MPDTVSADPDRLLRFVAAAGDGGASLSATVASLGRALDEVDRRCIDHRVPCPRLDRDLAQLVRDADRVGRRFLQAALRFLTADSGEVWSTRSTSFAPSFAAFWRLAEPSSRSPKLAALLQLAGDPSLTGDDLHEVGQALLGLGSTAKSAIDSFSRAFTAPVTLLSSPATRRLAEQAVHTPAGRRVLAGLMAYSANPLVVAADRGLTSMTLLEDINRLKRDGNPVDAWHRKGAGYIADLAGTGFDVSSSACAAEPNLVSCGAAGLSGATWAGAQAWQHRKGLASGVDLVAHGVVDEMGRLRSMASQALDATGAARDGLIDAIRHADRNPGLVRISPVITHAVADTVQRAGDAVDRAVDRAGHRAGELVSSGMHWLGG